MRTRAARTHRRPVRTAVTTAAALALAAALLTVLAPQARAAAGDWLYFGDGEATVTTGANGAVRAHGAITFTNNCLGTDGTPDFGWPVADIYVIATGSAQSGAKLVQADGTAPATVIGSGSTGAFIEELLAITGPQGQLDEGVYDVVFDNCQDGTYHPGLDSLHERAITVEFPAVLPPYDESIGNIKVQAALSSAKWLLAVDTWSAWDKAKNYKDPKQLALAVIGAPMSWLALLDEIVGFSKMIKSFMPPTPISGARNLMVNQAKHYTAIAEDPPDHDFRQPTVLEPIETVAPTATHQPVVALEGVAAPLATEGALAAAYLRALERYQGATHAADGEWALVHARELRQLALALAAANEATKLAVQEVETTFAALPAYTDNLLALIQEGERLRNGTWTPEQRRTLLNLGLTVTEMNELRQLMIDDLLDGTLGRGRNALLGGVLADLAVAQQEMADELRAHAARLDGVIAGLEAQSSVPQVLPVADAGGPYTATVGQPLTLDAGASRPGSGGEITTYDWDLDGDGTFDDASGATPTFTPGPTTPGVVGLRVTAADGGVAVAYAPVTPDRGTRPTITAETPEHRFVATSVGQPITLSATTSGGTAAWFRDGEPAGTGNSWTFEPAAADLGSHYLDLVVTAPNGAQATTNWVLTVTEVDDDADGWSATVDCNDSDVLVHPGMTEVLGNGIDDDCNPATADTPLDALSGVVSSWGTLPEADSYALGRAAGNATLAQTPADITGLGDVRRIAAGHRMGLAVTDSGAAWAWGRADQDQLGVASAQHVQIPAAVVGLSGSGQLGVDGPAVVDVASNRVSLALLEDGSAAAWGRNLAGALGTGDPAASNRIPALVRGPDDTLTGVTAIAAGGTFAAFLADGQVYVTAGVCGTPATGFAELVPGLSDEATTIAAGHGHLLITLADGSLHGCGANDHGQLGDGPDHVGAPVTIAPGADSATNPATDPARPVRIAAGDGFSLLLDADGAVWAWGRNDGGQLGAGTPSPDRGTPNRVVLDEDLAVTGLVAGHDRGAVTTAEGQFLTWGSGTALPTRMSLPDGSAAAQAGLGDTGEVTYLVLSRSRPVIAWGTAPFNSAGPGLSGEIVPTTTQLPAFAQVATNGVTGTGLTSDGRVLSWGQAAHLGNGQSGPGGTHRAVPGPVLGIGGGEGSELRARTLATLSTSGGKFGAILDGGQVAIWGSNSGPSGDGAANGYRPHPTLLLSPEGAAPLTGATQVVLGTNLSLALLDSGSVLAFGGIQPNPCAPGSSGPATYLPVPIPEVGTDIRQVAATHNAGFFLTRDGELLSCGVSGYVGRTVPLNTPGWQIGQVEQMGPGQVLQVAAHQQSTLVLKADGTVWGFGRDSECSLGCGPDQSTSGSLRTVPEQIPLPDGPPVVAIAHTHSVSFAIRADGSLLGWGRNQHGQTGLPAEPSIEVPTVVPMPGGQPVSSVTGTISSDGEKNLLLALAGDPLERIAEHRGTGIEASISDADVIEGGVASIEVTLNHPARVDAEIAFTTVDGTAVSGVDHEDRTGTVIIPAGQTSAVIAVPTIDNEVTQVGVERAFTVQVSEPSAWLGLADEAVTVTITDDDPLPLASVSVADPMLVEGDLGSQEVTLTISLDRPSAAEASVGWRTVDDTAAAPDDYVAGAGTAYFAPGTTQATFTVSIHGDTVAEPDEAFIVELLDPVGAGIGTGVVEVRIVDDEPVLLTAADLEITAPTVGSVSVPVVLDAPSLLPGESVQVPWQVTAPWATDGTALVGLTGSGIVTLTGQDPSATVEVEVAAGDRPGPQRFRIDVSGAVSSAGRIVLARPGNGVVQPAPTVDPDLPLAVITGPAEVDEGGTVTLSASGSTGVAPLSYGWDLDGDGEYDDATGADAEFIATAHGNLTVGLQVTDAGGATAIATHAVAVANVAPVVAPIADQLVPAGSVVGLSVSGSFTDPGANTWTATVDFGEGPEPLTLDARAFTVTYDEPADGMLVVVRVCDDADACGEVSFTVTVEAEPDPDPPAAVITGPGETDEGTVVTLSASESTGIGPLVFGWDVDGDGVFDEGTGPSVDVPAAAHGILPVGLRVTDANGLTHTVTHVVTVVNVAPVLALIPDQVLAAGAPLSVSGSFTDPGVNTWSATVDFGDGAEPLMLDGKSFTVTHPEPASGAVVVTVCDDADACSIVEFAVNVDPAPEPPPAPMITGVDPGHGPTAGGTRVVITGTGFVTAETDGASVMAKPSGPGGPHGLAQLAVPGVSISFGSHAGTSIDCTSAGGVDTCAVTTPAGAAGAVDVVLSTTGGTARVADGFTYRAPDLPAPADPDPIDPDRDPEPTRQPNAVDPNPLAPRSATGGAGAQLPSVGSEVDHSQPIVALVGIGLGLLFLVLGRRRRGA
ncbi:PKD domain-containing protein [Nocardioides sp. AE5]|uniref:PKD domain-containing protein n=1 Tax=Nocardioides sp. AE5 TaxID=2962573 RepID=UPI002881A16C|nr:PKD domain-containing protein [Nocardioides sp. AE5]MDT0203838.1 PKD domain-containing protein [Nocardioides sp. AE5]